MENKTFESAVSSFVDNNYMILMCITCGEKYEKWQKNHALVFGNCKECSERKQRKLVYNIVKNKSSYKKSEVVV